MSQVAEWQKDAIANMQVCGYPTEYISQVTGISPVTIRKYAKDEGDMARRRELAQAKQVRAAAYYRANMLDFIPDCINTIREGFATERPWREKFEAVKFVTEHLLPKFGENRGLEVGGKVELEMTANVQAGIVAVNAHLETLTKLVQNSSWLARVKEGPDALPGPAVKVRVHDETVQDAEIVE